MLRQPGIPEHKARFRALASGRVRRKGTAGRLRVSCHLMLMVIFVSMVGKATQREDSKGLNPAVASILFWPRPGPHAGRGCPSYYFPLRAVWSL